MANKRVGYDDSLNLTTSLCLSYTLVVALLRGWIRRSNYGVDDWVIAAAVAVCLGLFASNYAALHFGSGKRWNYIQQERTLESLNSASIASVVTFVISLYLSKCAVVAFLLRLTKLKGQIRLYHACIAAFATLGVASVLLVTVAWPLKSGYYFAFAQNEAWCESQTIRWNLFFVIDMLTEAVLLALPVFQVWNLQMPLKRKLTVVAAFYLRLPVVDMDAGRESAIVLIWLSVETSYAIASTTFSALRAFAMNFNSAFGLGFTANAGPDSYTLSRVHQNSGTLASGGKDSSRVLSEPVAEQKDRSLVHREEIYVEQEQRPTPASFPRTLTQISANRRPNPYAAHGWREDDSSDSERMGDGMVIRQDTEYTVDYHNNSDEFPILSNRLGR